MFDKRLQEIRDYLGVMDVNDWTSITPAMILRRPGVGPVLVDHIRMYLAARGLTLKNDQTAEHWQQHLSAAKIVQQLGDDELGTDRGVICPFTVLVDSAEQHPFTFQGFRSDADQGNRPLIVPTEVRSLGRFPLSLGDYSVDVGLGRCHVERKSLEDAQSTILGFGPGERRDRFEAELAALSRIEAGMVVVECSLSDLLKHAPARGKRTASQNAKSLHRSIIAFMQDFKVPWSFCDGRRLAEQTTFRWFERFARKQREAEKLAEKESAKEVKAEKAELLEAELAEL